MSSDKQTSVSVFKFNGTDYSVWKFQMQALLVAMGLGDPIIKSRPRNIIQGGTEDEKLRRIEVQKLYDKADIQAKSYLLLSLDNKYA